jgi:hypothetical protein
MNKLTNDDLQNITQKTKDRSQRQYIYKHTITNLNSFAAIKLTMHNHKNEKHHKNGQYHKRFSECSYLITYHLRRYKSVG